ncbi:MAG: hypothetical protein ACI8W7_000136 [Gammaproteobacteria bacterium]
MRDEKGRECAPAGRKDAVRRAQRATQLDDMNAVAHFALGRARLIRGKYDKSVAAFNTAIDLNTLPCADPCGRETLKRPSASCAKPIHS